jgi:hypothetical protein
MTALVWVFELDCEDDNNAGMVDTEVVVVDVDVDVDVDDVIADELDSD